MKSIKMLTCDVEVYSIDEAFARLETFDCDLIEYSKHIRAKILKWLGIPVSIGIANTKTLAKMANNIAKKHSKSQIFDLRGLDMQERVMRKLDVDEIWGISKGFGGKLNNIGIFKAIELRDADPKKIRSVLGVVGERIVYELRGVSCLGTQEIEPRKSITSSKSFGRAITKKSEIHEAIANYAVRACEKLRKQKSKASAISVYIQTNSYKEKDRQYSNAATFSFNEATNDTRQIASQAKRCIDAIFKEGFSYKKVGIMLLDLVGEGSYQNCLFGSGSGSWAGSGSGAGSGEDDVKNDNLVNVMDGLNVKMGGNTVFYASQGTKRSWAMRCDNRSKHYTTDLDELPVVRL